ncbi:MAG TPA: ABC transporter substrate-binding protein [Gemmatimonadaceae bacterium]|nr:ABC transporter substrate-binding protein [Gemmatimonadaceae bacterium]
MLLARRAAPRVVRHYAPAVRRAHALRTTALLPFALLTLLGACRGSATLPERHTLIDSRDRYDPRTLDPARASDVPSGRAVSYLFDGLTRVTANGSIVPGLALRWEVSPDGRVYTFHLRQGVTFHDGTPFRARQVKTTFERVLAPATRSGTVWPLYPIAGARAVVDGHATTLDGVTVVDDSTLRIRLERPLAVFPKLLAMPVASIVPDSVPANFSEHPVGTGPWKLVQWQHDDYLLFARNDHYFGDVPLEDSLRARIIPDPSTAVAEFERGNVDLLYIPEAETQQWENTDEKQAFLTSGPALRLWYVAINTHRGPLADARVRQALNLAVDVPTILNRLMGGRGRLAAGVIPPTLPGSDTTRAPYGHDVQRARALLAQAGYPNGIDVDLWHSQDETFARVALSIQAYLSEAGIRARIVQRDANAVRQAARNGEADLVLKDWYADYPDAEDFLYPLLASANRGAGGNVSFYSNPAYDRIVDSARIEQNDSLRTALYRRADAMQFRDAPMIYLFFYNELFAVQPWISGFEVPVIFNGQRWTHVRIGTPSQ